MFAWLSVALAAVPDTIEKKSGLPQLNVPDMAPQLIWLALTFGVLYFVLSRVTLPRIASVIEERRDRIQRDIDEADRLKGETDASLAAYEQALAEAHGRANAIARDTRDKLAKEVDEERSKVEAELASKLTEAEARIFEMRSQAMAQVDEIATGAAGDVVRRLIGIDVSSEEVREALKSGARE
ncbi:MAG: F0F1 ATP synthase subunit B' [Hyphomicrobiaceae bacterium]